MIFESLPACYLSNKLILNGGVTYGGVTNGPGYLAKITYWSKILVGLITPSLVPFVYITVCKTLNTIYIRRRGLPAVA